MEPSSRVALREPISILMPVCNEAAVLEDVVEEWVTDVIQYLPAGSELLFDEAASTDGTREILANLCTKYPFIKVMYQDKKEGFAVAARRLYENAACQTVFFTDSDGQYVPAEFWKLAPFIDDYPLIHGAKIGRQDPWFRKVASALFNRIARFIFDIRYSDINSAFRIVRKDLIKSILPRVDCMPTLLNAEFLIRTELENQAIKQVWVVHRPRKDGVSRGLHPSRFLLESLRAYQGLLRLKGQYKNPPAKL